MNVNSQMLDQLLQEGILPPWMEEAARFDISYCDIPIEESGEPLVSLEEAFKRHKQKAVFNQKLGPTSLPRLHLVRQGLVEPLVQAARDFLNRGYQLYFLSTYRRLEEQRELFIKTFRKVQRDHPELSPRMQYLRAEIYAACTPETAAHLGGAAVDVTLLSLEGEAVDLGGKYLDHGLHVKTFNSGLSEVALCHRQLLLSVMESAGFVNYPYEFWHFSLGDRIEARIRNRPVARYGPVFFNEKTRATCPVSQEIASRSFLNPLGLD